jgi:hypothetical protein
MVETSGYIPKKHLNQSIYMKQVIEEPQSKYQKGISTI